MAKKKQVGSRAGQGKRSKGHIGLGVKIWGDQKITAGSIVVRQRGNKYMPGKNVGMGRDHTIFSLIDGKVQYCSRRSKIFIDVLPVVQ